MSMIFNPKEIRQMANRIFESYIHSLCIFRSSRNFCFGKTSKSNDMFANIGTTAILPNFNSWGFSHVHHDIRNNNCLCEV